MLVYTSFAWFGGLFCLTFYRAAFSVFFRWVDGPSSRFAHSVLARIAGSKAGEFAASTQKTQWLLANWEQKEGSCLFDARALRSARGSSFSTGSLLKANHQWSSTFSSIEASTSESFFCHHGSQEGICVERLNPKRSLLEAACISTFALLPQEQACMVFLPLGLRPFHACDGFLHSCENSGPRAISGKDSQGECN